MVCFFQEASEHLEKGHSFCCLTECWPGVVSSTNQSLVLQSAQALRRVREVHRDTGPAQTLAPNETVTDFYYASSICFVAAHGVLLQGIIIGCQ